MLIQAYAMEAALAVRDPVPERAIQGALYAWAQVLAIPAPRSISPITPVMEG